MHEKVLLITNDQERTPFLRVELQKDGDEVFCATSHLIARQCLSSQRPALVILDLDMGDDDGFELCRDLAARPDLCVIAMSRHEREADCVAALELGADDYIHDS